MIVGTVILALLSAITGAIGTVIQQSVAASVDSKDGALMGALVRRPKWWLGYGLALVAVGFQVAALAQGSLMVVQPVIVLTLLFALALAARVHETPMSRNEWGAAALLVVSLAVFVVVGSPSTGRDLQPIDNWIGPGGSLLVGVLALVLLARFQVGAAQALALGLAAGALFGLQAGLTKATTAFLPDGLGAVFGSWQLYAFVATALCGVVLQQKAFAAWRLSASEPAIVVTTPVVSSLLGIAVFGEEIDATGVGWVVIAVAVVTMIATTLSLSRHSAIEGTVARPTEGKLKPVVTPTRTDQSADAAGSATAHGHRSVPAVTPGTP